MRVKSKRLLIEPNPKVRRNDSGTRCLSKEMEQEVPGPSEEKRSCHRSETALKKGSGTDGGDRWHKLTGELLNNPLVGQTSPYGKKLILGKGSELLSIVEGTNLPISKETRRVQSHNPHGFSIRRACSDGKHGERDPVEVKRRKAKLER